MDNDHTDHQACDDTCGVHLTPEKRKHHSRQVPRGRHGKRQCDKMRYVLAFRQDGDNYSESADADGRDSGRSHLFVLVSVDRP